MCTDKIKYEMEKCQYHLLLHYNHVAFVKVADMSISFYLK